MISINCKHGSVIGLIAAGYIASVIFAWGLINASLHSDLPWNCDVRSERDRSFALLLSIGGPASIFVGLGIGGLGATGWTLDIKHCS